jgi:hypothetical protein
MAAASAKPAGQGLSHGRICYAMAPRLPAFTRSRKLGQVC